MNKTVLPTRPYAADEERWEAVQVREAGADGHFVYAVHTTGVYCRPSSSARLPMRENVEFFDNAEAAEAAGYRASRRSRGDQTAAATERGPSSRRASAASAPSCWATIRTRTAAPRSRRLNKADYLALHQRSEGRFPASHGEFKEIFHRAGQQWPTPLLLRYEVNDYCCLHQDLYGEYVFPFQAVFLLDEPGRNFEGGELLLTESAPKRPGHAEVVPPRQDDAVVFAVNHRPVRSTRGFYRVNLRHGVSKLHHGKRHIPGIIFHDAK